MNRTTLTCLLLYFLVHTLCAQDPRHNYIIKKTFKQPGIGPAQARDETDPSKVNTTITYYDGMGRPIQTTHRNASFMGNDIVTPFTYDAYGRPNINYLPLYQNTLGNYLDDLNPLLQNQYDQKYTAESHYNHLNQITQQEGFGNDYDFASGRTTKEERTANDDSLKTYEYFPNIQKYRPITYPPGYVGIVTTTDLDGNLHSTYTDLYGKKIQERTLLPNDTLITYYYYDFYDQLTAIVPPHGNRTQRHMLRL